MKYLGVPIDEKRIRNIDWKPAENKMESKLGCWQGKWLAMGGKVSLINSSLSSIPLYMLSFYRPPKGPKERMDMHRSRFLWEEVKGKKKYHLVSWDVVCLPKDQGGLGILNLDLMNISLLAKWLWKLFNEDGMWQRILKGKYLSSKTLGQVESKPGDSHFWQGLMEVKKFFWPCCKIIVGNGESTRFWEDHWLRDQPLSETFPNLYLVSLDQNITVKEVSLMGVRGLRFRRAHVGVRREQWMGLCNLCANIVLSNEPDRLSWKLTGTGVFTVKSMYQALQNYGVVPYKFMWKIKIPMRVKTFLWLILKKSILTRDVLLHRGGSCPKNCLFCGSNETIDHLFFACPLARYVWNVISVSFGFNRPFSNVQECVNIWLQGLRGINRKLAAVVIAAVFWGIWKTRNLACFQKKWPDAPLSVIHRICYWIDWWSSLQVKDSARDRLRWLAKLLGRIATDVFNARRGWTSWTPRLMAN
jgi:hypothetical protein